MTVRLSACNRATPTARIFMKFDIADVYGNLSRNSKFDQYYTKLWGTLHEDLNMFYAFRRNKSNIKAMLWNTQYFYKTASNM